MKLHVTTPEAYRFWLEGAAALSRVESNGCRIDKTYLEHAITDTSAQIAEAEAALLADKDFRYWRRRFGDKTRPGSYDQLAAVVFGDLGFKAKRKTASGDRDAADAAAFEGIDIPLVKHYFTAAKLRKGRDTYLYGIRREMVQHSDGLWYVHPSYNLNTVVTFRSSCSDPNYQNIPNRFPLIAEIIRRCYIARPGQQLGEVDYGQIEVRIPCCYCHDPVLMAYVNDPTKDMHRDMACQLFFLKPKQVSKALRNLVKGAYVFATFYGSYYGLTCRDLWEGVVSQGITVDGTDIPMRDHLADNGIRELGDPDDPQKGTWAAHVKAIDDDFWGTRFKIYAQWKRDWYDAYLREGGFTMLTGFAVRAALDKKQVCNSPIQGSGFHCTLWSMTQLDNWLRKYRMKSCVIGEIHDSINGDFCPRERDDVLHAAHDIMTKRIKKWAPWLNVPLVVEPEVCPIGGSWFEKQALKESADGRFVPADDGKWEAKHGPWAKQIVEDVE